MKVLNNVIIQNYENLPELAKTIANGQLKIDAAIAAQEYHTALYEACSDVWTVIDGIALYGGDRLSVGAIDKTITRRCAGFYQNVNDQTLWGLTVYDYALDPPRREYWCGANWPSKQSVIDASVAWVIYGTTPNRR